MAASDSSDGSSMPELPAAGTAFGRYVIIGPAGHGGMAVVLLAYDPELDRRVALKFLRVAGLGDAGKRRLVREAQALARLSHPNVVPVYDIGTLGGHTFVAMEYVEGVTLAAWLDEPRPIAEIVARLRDAGRGLAAAHDAGLVHRDFKPANVLLGEDGRVRVVDFGLARALEDLGGDEPEPADSRAVVADAHEGHRSLERVTRDDHVVGTPLFMSPEQEANTRCDARSDQYSFGVTLHLALYGRPPGEVDQTVTLSTVDEHPGRRQTSAPPSRSPQVPAWLQRVVGRMLSVNPDERYPSMHEVLAALDRDPAAARRRTIGIAALVGLLALATGVVLQAKRAERLRCQNGVTRIASVWSEEPARRLQRAFADSALPYAPALAKAVAHQLDDYAHHWAKMDNDACAATFIRGEQSEEALDLRAACLENRRGELAALVQALSTADTDAVRHAGESAQSLTPLDVCADIQGLRAEQPRPREAARVTRIAALESRVAEVQARYAVGQARQGAALGETLLSDVAAAGYLPLQANLEHWLARCYSDLHDGKKAMAHFSAAFSAAVRAHADHTAAQVAVRLAQEQLFGSGSAHLERYEEWARIAEAMSARAGGDVSAELILARVRCISMFDTGQIDDRLRCIDGVVKRATEAARLTEWDVSMLGLANVDVGRLDDGVRWLERGVALSYRELGATHPRTLENRGFLCFAYDERGDADRAYDTCKSALADAETSATDQRYLLARLHVYLAQAQRWRGQLAEARALIEAAAAAHEEDLAPDIETERGLIAERLGHGAEAVQHLAAALALNEKTLRPDHPNVLLAKAALGEALLRTGDQERARRVLAPAEAALQTVQLSPLSRAELQFALARSLPAADAPRALELARAALDAYRQAPPTPRYATPLAEMAAFVRERAAASSR